MREYTNSHSHYEMRVLCLKFHPVDFKHIRINQTIVSFRIRSSSPLAVSAAPQKTFTCVFQQAAFAQNCTQFWVLCLMAQEEKSRKYLPVVEPCWRRRSSCSGMIQKITLEEQRGRMEKDPCRWGWRWVERDHAGRGKRRNTCSVQCEVHWGRKQVDCRYKTSRRNTSRAARAKW